MKRREFITLLGGATATWPMAARAQQSVPAIGILGPAQISADRLGAFRKGLNELGYVEGRNFSIEYRGTEHNDELPTLAGDLVRRQVSVIFTTGNTLATRVAMAATTSIPIVFAGGGDPVRYGLVASLNRPGGNVTGITYLTGTLNPKRLEIVRELLPSPTVIGFMTNPTGVISEGDVADMQAAARDVGQDLQILQASTADDIDAAFSSARQRGIGALIVSGDSLTFNRRSQLAVLAASHKIPVSYPARDYVIAGGLMSYGDDRLDSQRQAGLYVARILKGERPADLPVLQPTKFEFAINLRTAKALGITFPPSFHLRASEVIE